MTESQMPRSANDWADFLANKSLPSPFQVGSQVLGKLKRENLPYSKIAKQINLDPILAFYILSLANKDRTQKTEGSKTLAHAISMVGIDQLKTFIQNHPYKPIPSNDIKSFYYLRTLSTSLYAAHLGQAIAEKKSKGNPEDIFWSSLFVGVPIWYIWRFATPEMRLVRYAIRSNFKLPQTAEREILGDTMINVSTALAEKLELPHLAQECYAPDKQLNLKQWAQIARTVDDKGHPRRVEDRDISMAMQSPHFMVMLSNLIAHYSSYCWYSRATLRSQRILASYLQCPLDEAISLTHQAAADMSRAHPMPGLMLPAAKLFVPPRKRTKAKPEPEKSNKVSTDNKPSLEDDRSKEANKVNMTPAPIEPKSTNNPLYDELVEIMSQRPEEFTDLHELMNAATQGIAYGIELSRASVGLISKDGSRLKNYYSVGCQESEELKLFETKIIKSTIFEKLSARPASIWVKSSSDKKILDLIPMNFKSTINTNDFFLMSVFVSKKPVAIFYADNIEGKALTEQHYKQFKFLCGAVSTALQHQAKKK